MSAKREQLIEAALCLFRERGFGATGIDRILAEAGVAKNTLYKHFRSKDELILAALRREDERQRNWMMREIERRASSPRDRLLALFDVAGELFASPGFHGCPFIRASGEFSEADGPIRAACFEHAELIRRYIERLAEQAGAAEPADLSHQLALLFAGATVAAQASGDAASAGVAKSAAATLVEAACGPG